MIRRIRIPVVLTVLLVCARAGEALAQTESEPPVGDTTTIANTYPNHTAGEFTPAKGFDIVKTNIASLNISFYGLFRYINQLPAEQNFTDHLGRVRQVKARNDLNWHRSMTWLTGFFFDPKFRYNITLWSLGTTQQTLIFGNLQYRFAPALLIGVGILPNLTTRSMQGSWPFWPSSDRQMVDDFLRGGFSSGLFIAGEPVNRLFYTASVNSNISQLGVVAANDTRDVAVSGSLFWLPTTGEFGPRGGFGDLEEHRQIATRFGISAGHSREARYANDSVPPNATQIKLSDGVNPFDTGALAPGVTVEKLDYDEFAVDAGFKYRGFSFQSEYYARWLTNFLANGPLPVSSLFDQGVSVNAMHMVVRKRVGVYAVGGYVWDDFGRNPWEAGGGVSVYPSGTRSWRLNLHLLHVDKSPAASSFGFYSAGQTGTILSIGTDILM